MNAKEAYVLSRKYTKMTAEQFGAVKGAPCQIESIVDNHNKSHTMNFLWENNEGAQQRGELTLEDGEDGTYIVNARISDEGINKGHLIIKLNDGSVIDAGDVSSTIPIGSTNKVGGYKVGRGLTAEPDGTLNATGIEVQIDDQLDATSGNPVTNRATTLGINSRTEKVVQGSNGKALMFNENDGGGAKFEHKDGTASFVGVNDGGKNGLTAQIYSKDTATNTGSRLNITNQGMFYTNHSNSPSYTTEDEIAVKKDIPTFGVDEGTLIIH